MRHPRGIFLSPVILLSFVFLSLAALPCIGQESRPDDTMMKDCPMHAQHQQASHHAEVESHGDQAMGFAHDKTTHHFRMLTDGGAIEVTANDLSDKPNMEAIRSHLSQIAVQFGDGDFSTPMFVHDGVPPGATTMKLLKSRIVYKFEILPSGGRVRVQSADAIAIAAVHDFLRFQITEHQTGDSLEATEK